jgi:toxin CcdB
MAQFDVYATPFPDAPFVVQIQSDLLDTLATRLVIPLRPSTQSSRVMRLHPTVMIQETSYTLHTTETATVAASLLATPVQSVAAHRQDILDALDFLLHGF